MHRVAEQLADAKDPIAGLKRKDFANQVFQKMADFFGHPVVFRLDNVRVAAFVVVQIPQGGKRGNPHDGGDIAPANSLPPVFQPVFFRQAVGVHHLDSIMQCGWKGHTISLLYHLKSPGMSYSCQRAERARATVSSAWTIFVPLAPLQATINTISDMP